MMRSLLYPAAIAAALPLVPSPAGAVDFIRGDANGDGIGSVADVLMVGKWLFQEAAAPPCLNSADADDNGKIDLTDAILILVSTVAAQALPPPYPAAGPDPSVNDGGYPDCASYGQGTIGEAPDMALRVINAVAPGGDSGFATIAIALTTTAPIAGYSGRIRVGGDVVADVADPPVDRILVESPDSFRSYTEAGHDGDAVLFSEVPRFVLRRGQVMETLPPGDDVRALEITVCLKQGAPAGRYPLVLEAGEVADSEAARASRPTLISGELVIGSDVTAVASCKGGPVGPPPPPEQVNAAYKLGSVLGAPGSTVAMPFFVRADTPIQAYAFSVDFDEEVLEAVSGEYAW